MKRQVDEAAKPRRNKHRIDSLLGYIGKNVEGE
jgi:hypothetical protein